MSEAGSGRSPLTAAALHILTALAGAELHGYAIMQEVSRQTAGRYNLGPGTLYDNLQRLTEQGLVRPVSVAPASEKRRRPYRLTADGKKVLAAEIRRLDAVVRAARRGLPELRPENAS